MTSSSSTWLADLSGVLVAAIARMDKRRSSSSPCWTRSGQPCARRRRGRLCDEAFQHRRIAGAPARGIPALEQEPARRAGVPCWRADCGFREPAHHPRRAAGEIDRDRVCVVAVVHPARGKGADASAYSSGNLGAGIYPADAIPARLHDATAREAGIKPGTTDFVFNGARRWVSVCGELAMDGREPWHMERAPSGAAYL